jgi:hypothetical protein
MLTWFCSTAAHSSSAGPANCSSLPLWLHYARFVVCLAVTVCFTAMRMAVSHLDGVNSCQAQVVQQLPAPLAQHTAMHATHGTRKRMSSCSMKYTWQCVSSTALSEPCSAQVRSTPHPTRMLHLHPACLSLHVFPCLLACLLAAQPQHTQPCRAPQQ